MALSYIEYGVTASMTLTDATSGYGNSQETTSSESFERRVNY